MAEFKGQIVTNKGRNLLSRALAGEGKIIFTKAAFGNQKHTGNPREVEELKNKKLDLVVMNVRNDNGTAVLTVQISNEHVEESFRTEEFGVYAQIEGDNHDILYSYTTADEADYFPSNKLGKTFESIHEVYMAISSDTETEIYVRDGVIYLTKDIANQNYTENGVVAVGPLKGRSNLEENKSYCDEFGHWYKNIGGNRTWNGSGIADEQLIALTWESLLKLVEKKLSKKEPTFNKNTAFNKNFGEVAGTVAEGNKLAQSKEQLKAIAGNTFNPSYIQDAGQKIQGQFYIDRPTGRMFKCIQTTTTTNNNVTYFQDYSNDEIVKRLENLFKNEKSGTEENFIIGSFVFKMGHFIVPKSGNNNYVFALPFSKECKFISLIENDGSPNVQALLRNFDKNGFSANNTVSGGAFFFLAIGV